MQPGRFGLKIDLKSHMQPGRFGLKIDLPMVAHATR